MRARTLKEGTVGLLALGGLGLLVGLTLWLNDSYFGRRTYQIIVEFENADGLQPGSPVRYRGVPVGQVKSTQAESNFVAVVVEIAQAELKIPKNAAFEVERTGLIGDGTLSIYPPDALPPQPNRPGPLAANCDRSAILCHGSRAAGLPPIGYAALIRAVVKVADLVTSPDFEGKVDRTLASLTDTTADFRKLSRDAANLARSLQAEVGSLGSAARAIDRQMPTFGSTARSIGRTADVIGSVTNRTATSLTRTSDSVARAADRAGVVAGDLGSLVNSNRQALSNSLTNLVQTSTALRAAVSSLTPLSRRLNQSRLIENLDDLSSRAANTAAHLEQITGAISDPEALDRLRDTLDSARATFRNAAKISNDLDDFTGDPRLRQNLKNIINGLGSLISSTRDLQDQLALAERLAPTAAPPAPSPRSRLAPK